MTDKRHSIGIDVGGTKILASLFDERFRLLAELKLKTRTDKGLDHFIDDLVESVRFILKKARVDPDEVAGIGIGCPGFINESRGVIVNSPNIPFLKGFALADRLENELEIPVILGNDVQTGLYGEHQFGAAKGHANVFGIFLGTGVGGAMIINHQLYRGATGSAGEVGHVQYDATGPLCGCGRRGCLEAYTGRLAIASEAAILVARQRAPHLAKDAGTDLREIKSGALARAIHAGDRALEELIRSKAQIVGVMMANLANLVNPDLIVLGGGVVEAMPTLIAREAERVLREQAIGPAGRLVKVAVAKLGDHSIVMGAAKRATDRFTEKRVKERRKK
jgi:glucokinase